MNIPVNKKKPRAPSAQDTPMSSNLPNLSGSAQNQSANILTNSPASEQWDEAYRQLFDRN